MIPVSAFGVTLIVFFSSLAKGAHDMWAATGVYVAVLLLAAFWLIQGSRRGALKGQPIFLVVPLILLLTVGAVSVRRAVNPAEARFEWFDTAAASLLFLMSVSAFRTDKAARFLVAAMVPVFLINLIVNIFQYVGSGRLLFPPLPGTLINANVAAGFTLFWIPPLLANVREEGPGSSLTSFWAAGLIAAFVNLILTRSVWAWICLAVLLPLLLGPQTRREFLKRRPLAALGVGALIVGALIWMLALKWGELFGPHARGTSRFVWWRAAWAMFRSHPWFGIGLGNFPSAYLAFKAAAGNNTLYAHSSVLTILSETGAAGLTAVSFLVFTFARHLKKNWAALRSRRTYLHGLLLFGAFSLINLGTEYFVNLAVLFLFMAIAAAPAVSVTWRPRPAWVLAGCGLIFLSFPFVLSPFLAGQNEVYGRRQLSEGNYQRAMEAFTSAVALDPWSWGAHQGLAETFFVRYQKSRAESDIERAIEHQNKAIRLNRLNGLLYWEMGNYLFEQGKKGEAYSYFRKAVKYHKGNVLFENSLNAFREKLFGAQGI